MPNFCFDTSEMRFKVEFTDVLSAELFWKGVGFSKWLLKQFSDSPNCALKFASLIKEPYCFWVLVSIFWGAIAVFSYGFVVNKNFCAESSPNETILNLLGSAGYEYSLFYYYTQNYIEVSRILY